MNVGTEELTEADMNIIKGMGVYNESMTWKKANFAGIGVRVTAALFFHEPEKLFEVWQKFACLAEITLGEISEFGQVFSDTLEQFWYQTVQFLDILH